MFSSLGLFKNLVCPRQLDCTIPCCIFRHDTQPLSNIGLGDTKTVFDSSQIGITETPPLKRRRLDTDSPPRKTLEHNQTAVKVGLGSDGISRRTKSVEHVAKHDISNGAISSAAAVIKPEIKPPSKDGPSSVTRPISPPAKQGPGSSLGSKSEKLIPRSVSKAPAQFKIRLSLVEIMQKTMKSLNDQLKKQPTHRSSLLSEQELITAALDEEQQIAIGVSAEIYRNAMSQRVLYFKKMTIDDWSRYVTERVRVEQVEKSSSIAIAEPGTGLDSKEEIEVLRQMQTKLEGLEPYGYITKQPSENEIEQARRAVTRAQNYEVCDRCRVRFQVFPGRNSSGQLTTRGKCTYHWGKVSRAQPAAQAKALGSAESTYLCCNRAQGSEGCTTADTHVFKVDDATRLAAVLQFKETPENLNTLPAAAVAFDCEMGYTTYGMELIRVTATSWPHKETLLDVLVRPYGEILDLNTRFSGVSREQFAAASAYDDRSNPTIERTPGVSLPDGRQLYKVRSVEAARQLMFSLLSPRTPLIGHAIDNDLNSCRMIHPCVVDTVFLYPHPRSLPFRYGLKMLAAKYLSRNIQRAEVEGHDSREDAVATGDLVTVKVAEHWKRLKQEGWHFQDGHLRSPD